MSAMDVGARGMAAQLRRRADRSAVAARLSRSIARTGLLLPPVMAAPPTLAAITETSAVAGTLYAPFLEGNPTHLDKYSLLRGTWRPVTPGYPQYSLAIPDSFTAGDGTAGGTGTNKGDGTGGMVRFMSAAPDLEICYFPTGQADSQGFRLRVDGQYVSPAAITETSAVAGTLYAPFIEGNPAHLDKYSLLRGTWRPVTPGYPQYSLAIPDSFTAGDGTAGGTNTNKGDGTGGLVRFMSAAPDLEICYFPTGQADSQGFRLRVDGQYVSPAAIGVGYNAPTVFAYARVTWGDGSAANRRMRVYEIEGLPQFKFGGVKVSPLYAPCPAPGIDQLGAIVHGDSFVGGTGSTAASTYPSIGSCIALLLGQPDCINSGVGGTGYIANTNNQRNRFIQRVQPDVIARAPEVIVELGGINDEGLIGGSAATMQAAVTTWLDAVVGALPNVLIFMTGPMSNGTPSANRLAVRDGKKAAATLYPNNVVFIDNIAENWVTGTGKTGTTKGDGNADWVNGPDGVHPSDAGHAYLGMRVAQAIAARVPRG